ncbi:hypothetical protein ADIAL_0155 [Alkalibacterium sp. AK22]|nr:hypothetical protein ADIAL_0155 [Alkalibacterium sp. AK22]
MYVVMIVAVMYFIIGIMASEYFRIIRHEMKTKKKLKKRLSSGN